MLRYELKEAVDLVGHSVTGAIEGQDFLNSNVLRKLSPQQLVDCGGHPPDAYNYVKEAGGVQLDSDYPYVAQQQTCQFDENKVVTKIVGFVEIPHSEQILQQAVALYGPIAVAVDALHLSWVDYKKGIISDPTCKNTRRDMNHAILLIGYGTDENGTPYWLIKNSQGTGWGEQGYGRILRNANNMCGIASYANYPLI
ncbi:Cathepsin L [Clonorchis sinensis]|uniref:Cathepsin L n=1 Tax=Clonorchis sinensis TaxID=79923 RepID=A0A3R7JHQ1_CLOSI|nr:Cathepsin L [Clonorchis sinensis]